MSSADKMFYAWQSDRPRRDNKNFIAKCAVTALKQIGKEDKFKQSPRFGQDTEGSGGTPEVANTIFATIDDSTFFLADVTFVCETPADENGRTKLIPNPNVCIELGYAAKTMGWDRVILVMNTAYGSSSRLPFDLIHRRHPVQYSLPEGTSEADRDVIKCDLVAELKKRVKVLHKAVHNTAIELRKKLDTHCMDILRDAGHGHFSTNNLSPFWPAAPQLI